jgi:hypothetical protein
MKGRKENVQASPLEPTVNPADIEGISRKVSMQIVSENNGSLKRQRIITPAASKAIDDADEPRSSPSLRKVSVRSTKQYSKEGERKVLGGIENV